MSSSYVKVINLPKDFDLNDFLESEQYYELWKEASLDFDEEKFKQLLQRMVDFLKNRFSVSFDHMGYSAITYHTFGTFCDEKKYTIVEEMCTIPECNKFIIFNINANYPDSLEKEYYTDPDWFVLQDNS